MQRSANQTIQIYGHKHCDQYQDKQVYPQQTDPSESCLVKTQKFATQIVQTCEKEELSSVKRKLNQRSRGNCQS
jgi:hypothetical protein